MGKTPRDKNPIPSPHLAPPSSPETAEKYKCFDRIHGPPLTARVFVFFSCRRLDSTWLASPVHRT